MQYTTLAESMDESEAKILTWSRGPLFEIVWEYRIDGDGRLVGTRIRRLRTEIGVDPAEPTIIRAVRGLGYELVA